jgi:hopene-associated glycosyltransferase HpnB
MVGQTLPTLLAQPEVELVVLVDDGSGDGTAEAAREAARTGGWEDRVRVVEASPTPEGWAGKVNAMACGLAVLEGEGAAGEWLLFTDADIAHRQGTIAGLLARADEGEYDQVSIMARLRVESLWERLLVPTFVFFFQLLYPFRQVARGETAAAAGGCVLLRHEALERAGGLASIAGAVIDDVALARSVAGAGGRLWLGLDPGVRSLRPYPHLADLWRMVARSAYDQLGYRLDLLLAVLAGLALFFVGPAALLAYAVAGIVGGQSGSVWLAVTTAAALVLQFRLLLPSVRYHGLSATWAKALPVSSLLFGAMTVSSAWAHYSGRGVSWRGRKAGGA